MQMVAAVGDGVVEDDVCVVLVESEMGIAAAAVVQRKSFVEVSHSVSF